MKKISIDGNTLNFIESNQDKSKTLLFIHGNSHSLKTFKNQMNSQLLKDYRMIAVDLPGHGDSSKNGNYSLKSIAQLLHKFITALELNDLIIVGHSLGGHIGINLLKYYNPRGLLIFGTPPLKNPFDPSVFLSNPNASALFQTESTLIEIVSFMKEMNYENEALEQGVSDYLGTDPVFRQEVLSDIGAGLHEDEVVLINSFEGQLMFLLASQDSLINNKYILTEFRGTENAILEVEAGHSPHIEVSELFNEMLSNFSSAVFLETETITNLNNGPQPEISYEQRD